MQIISSLKEFLLAHQSLGSMYYPAMGAFTLSIAAPLWIIYIIINFCSYTAYQALQKKYTNAVYIDYPIRLTLDAIYNPCALPLYYAFTNYFFKNSAYITLFGFKIAPIYYQNSLGLKSLYPLTYFISIIAAYYLWFYYQNRLLRYLQPRYSFKYDLQSRVLAPTRLLGSCAILIVVADFDPVIDKVLYGNVLLGAAISIGCYGLRVFNIINKKTTA